MYSLPLSRQEFSRAVQAGLGRAMLHVRSFGAYPEVLLEFCYRHPAYDPQCEYDRTPWLLQLVLAAGLEQQAVEAVRSTLGQATRDYDLNHAARLAAELARLGHEEARQALYHALERDLGEWHWAVLNPLLELEGPAVMQKLEAWLDRDPELQLDPTLVDTLEELGAQTASLRARTSSTTVNVREARLQAPESSEELSRPRGDIHSWARTASEEELLALSRACCTELDPTELKLYLSAFFRRPLPEYDPKFLDLLDHPDPFVRSRAARALANTRHPAIREAALARNLQGLALQILAASLQEGDAALVLEVLSRPEDLDDLHQLVFPVVEMFAASPYPDAVGPLLWAYDASPCSLCRGDAYRALSERQALTEPMLREAPFDSLTCR